MKYKQIFKIEMDSQVPSEEHQQQQDGIHQTNL